MWKIATVLPIAKNKSACSFSDFRPISILPTLSKVAESLMSEQIYYHVSKFNLLSPFQSGFRSKHSCSTAMIKILDDIRISFDKNHLTLLCLLDFSKAFDSVNHELLCLKLKNYFGFGKSAVRLMESYLVGRSQCVKVDSKLSKPRQLSSGVPKDLSWGRFYLACL